MFNQLSKPVQLINYPIKLLMALLLCLTLMVGWVPAYGVDGPTISVGSAGEISQGAEFTVPVTIENNSGFAACALELKYDTAVLELVGFDTSGLLKGSITENVAGSSIGYLSLNNISENGVLFGAKFKVRDDAAGGSYDVTVALKDGHDSNFVNAEASVVPVNFTAGSVTIPGGEVGSPNTDTDPNGNQQSDPNSNPNPNTNTNTNSSDPKPVTVTAKNSNGDSVQLQLRGEAGNLEYSQDGGVTWSKVPEDGIVTTEDGSRISIFGDGDADYYVQDLPENMVPKAASEQGTSPLVWVIVALVAAAIVIAAIAVITSRRRKASIEVEKGPSGQIGSHSRS